jgi:hypothetical protein
VTRSAPPAFEANWSLTNETYTDVTNTSEYKNHGDYVSSQGGGSENAHSPIGKPVNSNSDK